jgi:hypothetical protein
MSRSTSSREAAKRRLDASIHQSRAPLAVNPAHLAAYGALVAAVQSRGTALSRHALRDALDPNPGLVALAARARDWIRPPDAWSSPHASPWVERASLAEHLLARYPLPRFLASIWFDRPGDADAVPCAALEDWYLRLGRGENIRRVAPVPLTRAMAHAFVCAPCHLTAVGAIRWAQVVARGGGRALAAAIVATRLGRAVGGEDFWDTVIRFFVAAPELDLVHVGPIVDFLQFVRFGGPGALLPSGERATLPAPRPDFAVEGRTPRSLLRLVHDWHRALGRLAVDPGERWPGSRIRGLRWIDHVAVRRGDEVRVEPHAWEVRELCSTGELVAEGRTMRHCVATYAARCLRGEVTIWSLQVETTQARRRVLTIEVDMARRLICQARRKYNAWPSPYERAVLGRWAAREALGVVDALRG